MKTPDYVTIEDIKILKNENWDKLTIPANTFVRPIELYYLPAHTKDTIHYRLFDPIHDIFVYCRYGIVAVPKKSIRRI